MRILQDTLPVSLEELLARPLFAHLATASETGQPCDSPVWFLWEDGAIWIIAEAKNTFPARITHNPRCAIGIVDFDRRTGRVWHVGMRGRARVERIDIKRVERLLARYLGPHKESWDPRLWGDAQSWEGCSFIRFEPETVVARDQSYRAAPAPSSSTDSGVKSP
ncbi:pyridoxamine 5'-phosphate oxidase family protein [Limnochorda pilosa]|uniref:Pyridoxamine 5-phosphate oxidase n=1 Tax=Limnochorda pilosa TaxID=1555112 RepID=A0A0K2SIB3_LIMPI|nr:pyridoxamine 5'-phosphate oxidase family protein [Limnochorda pilosa]BAS26825.1 pyridoxamine 5-phosphate oxidase [Limnochorda pilosa]